MQFESRLLQRLHESQSFAVLTGAGVSAESGVPTFRDKTIGLWERFDAAELATPQAFRRDPALVWGWYQWRRRLVRRAQPNAAHRALASWQSRVPHFTLITQNVDDLHERAGSRVLHLHGQLTSNFCEACRHPMQLDEAEDGPEDEATHLEPPRCPLCGARIRPGVVWFGEGLPQAEWSAALEAARGCSVFMCVGTSALVQPAASLTQVAIDAGALTLQVNPNATPFDGAVDYALKGSAGTVLPELLRCTYAEG
jgi:NAD-dependent deacetylase